MRLTSIVICEAIGRGRRLQSTRRSDCSPNHAAFQPCAANILCAKDVSVQANRARRMQWMRAIRAVCEVFVSRPRWRVVTSDYLPAEDGRALVGQGGPEAGYRGELAWVEIKNSLDPCRRSDSVWMLVAGRWRGAPWECLRLTVWEYSNACGMRIYCSAMLAVTARSA